MQQIHKLGKQSTEKNPFVICNSRDLDRIVKSIKKSPSLTDYKMQKEKHAKMFENYEESVSNNMLGNIEA